MHKIIFFIRANWDRKHITYSFSEIVYLTISSHDFTYHNTGAIQEHRTINKNTTIIDV